MNKGRVNVNPMKIGINVITYKLITNYTLWQKLKMLTAEGYSPVPLIAL